MGPKLESELSLVVEHSHYLVSNDTIADPVYQLRD